MNMRMLFFCLILLFATVDQLCAEPDYYYGDSAVYTGSATKARPNIMFLIDNSGAMKDMGTIEPYDAAIAYEGDYPREYVYLRNVANENNTNFQTQNFEVDDIVCSSSITDVQGTYSADDYDGYGEVTYQIDFPNGDGADDTSGVSHPRFALEQNGFWYGALDSQGRCPNNQNQWENYYTGNFRNYLESVSETSTWTANTSYAVGDMVTDPSGVSGLILKCVVAGTSGGSITWTWSELVTDSTFADNTTTWKVSGTILEVVQDQMEHVVFNLVRDDANMGMMTFGDNNHGGSIIMPIVKAGREDTGGDANLTALVAGLTDLEDLVNGNTQPVNESMWDAYLYWIGEFGSSDMISSDNNTYDSPIEHWCQSNHLVILTTGSAGNNSQTKTKIREETGESDGDLTGDGFEGLVDDAAVLLHDYLNLDVDGYQPKVKTHIIQLMTPEVERLRTTAEEYGHGIYRNINDPGELLTALTDIIAAILEEDSSFIAPVVPASPENRAYSGRRIYLGFFKPMNDEPWYGNLKKFGLGYGTQITAFDSSGNEVLATDADGYFLTDGSGNPTIHSYWGTDLDGGQVDAGGVGALLKARAAARNIYTRTGTNDDLNASVNAFNINADGEANVSPVLLGLVASEDDITDEVEEEAVKLTNFIRGLDAYADFSDDTTAKRYWLMGDVMHSKPVVLNYTRYAFTADNEADEDLNKSYIFVGANDGMLHAFKDSTGEEAWAFIPPDLLPNLQYLHQTDYHYYFVDNSPVIYVYDADDDGSITSLPTSHPDYDTTDTSDNNDKAVLLFGLRRGGGTNKITQPLEDDDPPPSRGSYYALDVSDPENPQFMWQINSESDPDGDGSFPFGELGETWSVPRLTKMKIGTSSKIVAIFGAGYDTNEDLRYGNTQTFPDGTDETTDTSLLNPGAGDALSNGTSAPYSARGRGIFIVEVATLTNGVTPNFTNSGDLLWSYTYADDSDMTYSLPSDPLAIDLDSDYFTDVIYIGDAGGQMWRFDVSGSSISEWTGTRIFIANQDDSSDVGRKIFYKATATISGLDTFLYFGAGDREHPLNTAVTDRFYVVRDRRLSGALTDGKTATEISGLEGYYHIWDYTNPLTEDELVDVTKYDYSATKLAQLRAPYFVNEDDVKYGWSLKLVDMEVDDDGDDAQVGYGEKVLAVPKVVENILYFSTYTPITPSAADDPCQGELGPSRLYAVKADTGEAAYNFNILNDTNDEDGSEVPVLEREDRSMSVGDGIASEPLIMVDSTGAVSVIVGRGGGFINTGELETIDPVFPVYWMKW